MYSKLVTIFIISFASLSLSTPFLFFFWKAHYSLSTSYWTCIHASEQVSKVTLSVNSPLTFPSRVNYSFYCTLEHYVPEAFAILLWNYLFTHPLYSLHCGNKYYATVIFVSQVIKRIDTHFLSVNSYDFQPLWKQFFMWAVSTTNGTLTLGTKSYPVFCFFFHI